MIPLTFLYDKYNNQTKLTEPKKRADNIISPLTKVVPEQKKTPKFQGAKFLSIERR